MHWLDELNSRKKELGRMLAAQVKETLADKPQLIIGSDEVGYGAWAGPLVVCAVSAPYDWSVGGLKDSKELSEAQREDLVVKLYGGYDRKELFYSLVIVAPGRIDELGVGQALKLAHTKALEMCCARATSSWKCVVDGNVFPGHETIMNLPKADTLVPQAMAASVIAKYSRDNYMRDMASVYPGYGFENHVGYGTPEHKAAIKRLGPCDLHRRSYKPFKEMPDEPGHGKDGGDVQETVRKPEQIQRDAAHSHSDVRGQRTAADGAGGAPVRKDRRRRGSKA